MNYTSVGLWLDIVRWPWQPQVVIAVLAVAFAYALGARGSDTPAETPMGPHGSKRWRSTSFYLGLATFAIALQSPIDSLSDYSFAWHMAQHMIIMLVCPPLLIAGRPLLRFAAALERFGVSSRSAILARVRGPIAVVSSPNIAIPAFVAVLWVSHLPLIYDLSLRNDLFHETEHLVFLAVALMYWGTVIDIAPHRSENSYPKRIVFLGMGILACWVLGVVLAFAVGPLYRPYLAVAGSTLHGVVSDQALGSAIMWAPSMIPFDIFLTIYIQRWLAAISAAERAADLEDNEVLSAQPHPAAEL